MGSFNDIGIDSEIDWDRITHLFKLGIIAALMVLAGDTILGWGVTDEALTGMDAYFSRYKTVSDTRVFASAIFGLIAAITQIVAFAKGLTPYPKWCWVFSMLSGIVVILIMRFVGNHPLAYAVSTSWISIGALWTFGGLLVMSSKVRS